MSNNNPRKKALVIAVSEYADSSNLKELPFCKKDGDAMASLLKDLGYEIKNQLIGKVDGITMNDEIADFFENDDVKHTDTILLYYSGHGIFKGGKYYLAPTDIKPKSPTKRGFSFDELTALMEASRSKRIVVVLDCCYAGFLKLGKGGEASGVEQIVNVQKEKINELKEGEGKCILSACSQYQEAVPNMREGYSFFTHYLLEGLKGANGKSLNKDGVVTPESLMDYIDSEIDDIPSANRPDMTPVRKIEVAGKIVLSDPRLPPPPPPIPVPTPDPASAPAQDLLKLLQDEKIEEFNKLRRRYQPEIFERGTNASVKNVDPPLMLDLHGVVLSKKKLSEARLELVNLSNADLSGADLSLAQLDGSNLSSTNLEGANLSGSDLHDVNLQNSNLKGVTANNSVFKDVIFKHAKMEGVRFDSCNFTSADFTEARLLNAQLTRSIVTGANFTDALVANANFGQSYLEKANFTSVNLTGTSFFYTNLKDAIFKNATLANNNFDGVSNLPPLD